MTKYNKISLECRRRIAAKVDAGISTKNIAESLEINYQTVNEIIKSYLKTGTVDPKPRGGDKRSILSIEQKEEVLSWVDNDCHLTLKNITSKVRSKFGITVSKSTIDCCLRMYHYSLKKVSIVSVRRNVDATINERF